MLSRELGYALKKNVKEIMIVLFTDRYFIFIKL